MDNIMDTYELIVGVFLPLLISTFVKEEWSAKTKAWIAFMFVVIASFGHAFYAGELDWMNIPITVLKILALTVITYKGFWNPVGLINGMERRVGIK